VQCVVHESQNKLHSKLHLPDKNIQRVESNNVAAVWDHSSHDIMGKKTQTTNLWKSGTFLNPLVPTLAWWLPHGSRVRKEECWNTYSPTILVSRPTGTSSTSSCHLFFIVRLCSFNHPFTHLDQISPATMLLSLCFWVKLQSHRWRHNREMSNWIWSTCWHVRNKTGVSQWKP
jgi:hypothetical protein